MIKKYIVTLIAVLLIFTPARAFAVEQDNTVDDGTGTYYGEPWQEEAPYDNTYEEPGYGENYPNNGTVEEGAWNDGYTDQYTEPEVYEEPYTEPETETYEEPYTEPEVYTEPETETYEEPYTEPEVYEEPYTEPVTEPEPEEELSINTVKGEGYTVSGVVTVDNQPAENVKLLLSTESDSIETVSNDNGEFTFEDVANGTYTLSAADSEIYKASAEPVEVTVENRNKLGYDIAVTPIEADQEEAPEETEEVKEPEEELPVEEAETDQQSSDASDGMSPFELILIAGGTILLLAAIGIALFRKISAR